MKYGQYEVTGELGRGGMGLVHRARSPEGREVAIKVLLRGRAGAAAVERFARERRLLAELTLAHGFVPIIDAGDGPTGPYLVLPLVTGGTLRAKLRAALRESGPGLATGASRGHSLSASTVQGQALPVDDAVSIVRQVAAAMGEAHRRGIVHRDLKPENIMFTDEGRPLVSDLGLAKHFAADAPGAAQTVALTQAGEARGTIGYMAPEQINDSKSVGPPADVFALGVILYEALAGAAPFAADSAHGVMARVALGEFTPLRVARPDCPAWVARVVERALGKRPADRHPDGDALAQALAAGDTGSTIPPGRRGLAIGVLAGLMIAAVATGAGLRAIGVGHGGPSIDAPGPGAVAATSTTSTTSASPSARHPGATGPRAIPPVCASLAQGARLTALCGDLTLTHDGGCAALALLPDGRLASGGFDGAVRIWDLGAILRGERPSGEERNLLRHDRDAWTLALSPDGERLLSGGWDQTVIAWDLAQGKELALQRVSGPVRSCAWSEDGARIVTGSEDGAVHVWDPTKHESEPLASSRRHAAPVQGCVFLPDGRVASASLDGTLVLWDPRTDAATTLRGHEAAVHAVALTDDGRLLSTSEDATLREWDTRTGAALRVLRGHGAAGSGLRALAVQGGRALTGGRKADPTLRAWDLARGEPGPALRGHEDEVYACALALDGRHAVSGAWDPGLRVWDLEASAEAFTPDGHRAPVVALAFAQDGRLWSAGEDGTCRLWDPRTGREVRPALRFGEWARALAVSADGGRLLVGGHQGALRLYDVKAGDAIGVGHGGQSIVQTFPGHQGYVHSVALSDDGARALSAGEDTKVRLWDVATGTVDDAIPGHAPGRAVAFLRQGRFASIDTSGSVRVFEVASGAQLFQQGIATCQDAAISADGLRAFVVAPRQPMYAYGLRQAAAGLPAGVEPVRAERLALSHDARVLVSIAGRGGAAWRITGGEVTQEASFDLAPLRDRPRSVAVAKDGHTFAVGTSRGAVLIFEPR